MYKVVSFDIFDTCLVRSCGTPECLFDVLSNEVFTVPVADTIRKSFVAERIRAERIANKKCVSPGITDIYKEFRFEHPLLKPVDSIVGAEMSLEKKVLLPVYSMRDVINGYRAKGIKIVYISDMYLSGEFLTEILKDKGLMKEGDSIYVSSDYKAKKSDGRLFDIVKKNENLLYSQWLHYGDHPVSDYAVPKSKGIRAKRVFYKYNYFPSNWIVSESSLFYRFGSILAGLSRSLMNLEPANSRTSFVLDLVAPLYCSFCNMVLKDATDRGIHKLYFCARDTYHLFNLAKYFICDHPNIEVHYLYMSRHSLVESDSNILLKYLEQEGLASIDHSVAIVDCSSTGNTLRELNRLLKDYGYNELYGYYLIKYDRTDLHIPETWYTCIIREDYSNSPLIQGLLTHILIIESMMSSNTQQRTDGYRIEQNGEVFPVFCNSEDVDDISQADLPFWERYYEHVLMLYAIHYRRLGLVPYSHDILFEIALPSLLSFFSFPVKEYVKSLEGIRLVSHKGRRGVPYVLGGRGLFYSVWNQIQRPYWRRGTIVNNWPEWLARLFVKYNLKYRYEKQMTSSYR